MSDNLYSRVKPRPLSKNMIPLRKHQVRARLQPTTKLDFRMQHPHHYRVDKWCIKIPIWTTAESALILSFSANTINLATPATKCGCHEDFWRLEPDNRALPETPSATAMPRSPIASPLSAGSLSLSSASYLPPAHIFYLGRFFVAPLSNGYPTRSMMTLDETYFAAVIDAADPSLPLRAIWRYSEVITGKSTYRDVPLRRSDPFFRFLNPLTWIRNAKRTRGLYNLRMYWVPEKEAREAVEQGWRSKGAKI
ncbi:hypothetical protein LZ31DRAFT_601133 [Colletotrichum somersetense]|nr:hypothetical protein LZ31DRAFT_601133 [Colletotrichum somersetense]